MLDYMPLLTTFFEGLRETDHPYTFVVAQGIRELLSPSGSVTESDHRNPKTPGSNSDANSSVVRKTVAALPSLVSPLRAALNQRDKNRFLASLEVFVMLAQVVKHEIVPFLGTVLPPIAARALAQDAQIREAVQDALAQCQMTCGDAALKIIRARVPTFAPLMI